jgi:hypothetical protein
MTRHVPLFILCCVRGGHCYEYSRRPQSEYVGKILPNWVILPHLYEITSLTCPAGTVLHKSVAQSIILFLHRGTICTILLTNHTSLYHGNFYEMITSQANPKNKLLRKHIRTHTYT